MRIAINGFGRIGRSFLRTILYDARACEQLQVAAINIGPSAPLASVSHSFKYDTIMKEYEGSVSVRDTTLKIDSHSIPLLAIAEPEGKVWKELAIDWVVDCSGKFTKRQKAQKHLDAGARYVLISAPTTDEDVTIIPGVNQKKFDKTIHKIVSLGSCTTNALMPTLKVLYEHCGLQQGFMSTAHAYTTSQALLDSEGKDPRRARAAAVNIVPTSTGAVESVAKVMPELAGKIDGSAVRVPVPIVSFLELTFIAERSLTVQEINDAFVAAASNELKEIIALSFEPLVSSDFAGNPSSVIIDMQLTKAIGSMGRVSGWYDNEWAYSQRLKDFLLLQT